MKNNKNRQIVKSILIEYFQVPKKKFSWDISLQNLNSDFMFLETLLRLENEIRIKTSNEISLIDKINSQVSTPKDLVDLIEQS